MAKAEFYEIIIKDKEKNEIFSKGMSLNEVLLKSIVDNDEHDKFCQSKKCAVILNNHIKRDENNIVYDFAMFTDKKIISTLISEPLKSEDTFVEYDKKILETTNYTKIEEKEVKEIVSLTEEDSLIDKLKSTKIDNYKIYKIILDYELLEKKQLELFEKFVIKRLKKDSIFFNIIEDYDNSEHKILIYQSLTDGLDISYLEKYLNTHLLVSEDFKLNFHKLYDADFMDLLLNGELKSFIFSYSTQNKSNLLDKNLFNPLYHLGDLFGKNLTKVEIKAKDEELLDNNKLIDFFEKASETGFLDTCELKQKGGGNKKIDFKDKKLNIEYTESQNIDTIHKSVEFFERALKKKKNILKKRLGI